MLTPEQEKWISHLSDEDKVSVVPWDSACSRIFEKIKEKIQVNAGKDLEVFHRGASGLGISGQDEVDVYIPVSPNEFKSLEIVFNGFLGEPKSIYPLQRIRYTIRQDGKRVDIFIVNKEHSDWTNSIKFENYLRNNPDALESYRILKENGNGLTIREYYRRKVEFINSILSKNFKIAIIGGGLVGLYLAWKLSEQGHNVSVFDRKSEEEIGKKVCSALFSERIKDFIPQAGSCVKNEINGCVINFPKKKIKLNFNPKHLVVDREKLSSILVGLAKQSGTQIFFGEEMDRMPSGFDYIIGCDGAASITRRMLKLSNPAIALGAQIFMSKTDDSDYVATHPTETGFCWKIPTGDCVEYGIMGGPGDIEKEFADFLKQQQVENYGKIMSAAIPQPKFTLKDAGLIFPKEKNITLCGDASGLTKPWSGGGVIWGLTQANILLRTFPDFEEYRKQTVKKFRLPILKGQISKTLVHFIGNNFSYLLPSEIAYDNDFPSFAKSLLKSIFKG
jgi:flavin-dependent dehydrogenase/GrpB-like predicted nucleotidyltransferase (UPF0157 family)